MRLAGQEGVDCERSEAVAVEESYRPVEGRVRHLQKMMAEFVRQSDFSDRDLRVMLQRSTYTWLQPAQWELIEALQ